ncbi:MAG TPA: thrombospondin type 3 repeat-containing protein [Polyangia bacterium]|nr:thrombospondin type 3 repeat-containing protein [Polyangia bacterium]
MGSPSVSRVGLTLAAVAFLAASHAEAAPTFSRSQAQQEPDDWTLRIGVGLDVGLGGTITDFSQDPGPSGTLFFTGLRGTFDVSRGFAAMLTLDQWWLPGPDHALLIGFGTRYEPFVYNWGRIFFDLALGPASTAHDWCFGFDVGAGVEFSLPDVPGFGLGPYIRYGDFINPDTATSNDGTAWSLGATLTFHFGRYAEAPHTSEGPAPKRGAWHISIPDTDRDGVADDEDQCKTVPAGKHPDPFRPGCPENDEDNDGIPDVDDPCPVTPPGDHADPKRPGCPFIDTDGDNISDADDACPTKPGVASPDPAQNGCPDRHARRRPVEEEPPPPKDESAPIKPVKKHSRSH